MKKSIKTKLIVLIFVLIALPIFLLGLLSYRITAKSIQGIVEQSIRSLTDRTSKSIEEKMDSVDRSIKILSCDENLAQVALGQADDKMKKDCFDYIEDIQKDNKSVIEKIVIVNLDKKAVLTNDNLNPNIDLSNRKYLQKTLSGTSSKSNVILSKFTGNPAIAIAHPLKENDKIVGAVIGFINFKNISKYAQDIHIGKKGYAYMFDNKGVYVYHPNKNMIFKDNIYNHKNKDAENLIKKLETNKYSEGYYNYNGKKFTRLVKVNDWILCVTADYNEYMNPAIKIRQFTIFLSLIFIIVSILVAYMRSSKNLIDPIIDIEKALLRVKDGDLTVKVNVNTGDEIESLANAFNKTIEYERNLIESIRNSSEELSTSGEELAASAEEINSSTEEISQSMDKVSDDSTNQNKYIVETSEVLVQLSSLVQLAQKKASTTKQNSDETMKTANNGRIMVKHTVEAIDSIKNSAGETAKVLQVVEDLSKKVEEIIGTINSISEQTNLLALNAAIEAARAGEHGKGFSVVAEEVKNLSEESNAGAVEIASLIKEMVSKIKKAVESMDNNKKVIANGVKVVNKTDSAFITIINSVESIGNDIDKIVEITKDEVASSDQIIKLIDNVATISENTAASTEEVASAVEEQSCATETLSEASQVSSNMAIKLNELASKFKIE